jgi:hypothetical protein
MWDTLGWGGETQALIYNPHTGKVQGINALGVAPSGATVEFFRKQGMVYPPEYGPLAAVTPGTPGGLMVMLSEYGTLSLAEVLAPAMEMAKGYPIEESQADNMESRRELLAKWPGSRKVFLPHLDEKRPRAARGTGGRRNFPPAGLACHPAEAGGCRGRGAGRRQESQASDTGCLRAFLSWRHRPAARRRLEGPRWADDARRTWIAGRCTSRNRSAPITRASTSTNSPAGCRVR